MPTPEERLVREFHEQIPADVVAAEIATAERELRGQVPDGALEEMVHRLVAYRLCSNRLVSNRLGHTEVAR